MIRIKPQDVKAYKFVYNQCFCDLKDLKGFENDIFNFLK
jgi:hypothetical protein